MLPGYIVLTVFDFGSTFANHQNVMQVITHDSPPCDASIEVRIFTQKRRMVGYRTTGLKPAPAVRAYGGIGVTIGSASVSYLFCFMFEATIGLSTPNLARP